LAAAKNDGISILDWGGGLGHYCEFSKSLLPSTEIDYHCREVSLLCQAGRKVLPDAHFYDDDRCLERKYDLVFSSSSLQYCEDWKKALADLASATSDYLYVTRLPIVEHSSSFVVVQRPYTRGYDTEYIGWFINRDEFLDCLKATGVQFVREFHIEPHPPVANAPAPATSRGFLARRLS
jgi:putative methyltransferase (TIGR04325 family)